MLPEDEKKLIETLKKVFTNYDDELNVFFQCSCRHCYLQIWRMRALPGESHPDDLSISVVDSPILHTWWARLVAAFRLLRGLSPRLPYSEVLLNASQVRELTEALQKEATIMTNEEAEIAGKDSNELRIEFLTDSIAQLEKEKQELEREALTVCEKKASD